jgi:hypothetical protein
MPWGDARVIPGGCLKSNKKPIYKKNHALAESLLSRVFSWDVVDVGFPTCLKLVEVAPATYLKFDVF